MMFKPIFSNYIRLLIVSATLYASVITQKVTTEGINNEDYVVQLVNPSGKVRGHILQSFKGINYYAFQDIPYASPPINNLRFKPPQKHDGWEGVLNTTTNTRKCPQEWISEVLQQSEDCLYLNVYTPVKPGANKKLAVYVWIYGGSFLIGDGSIYTYDPKYLMDYGIIVVTFNYRLGVLGLLTTDDGVIVGNLALRDQHFALKWVNENIQLFGGDPSKVTIGGESSGASSACFQMLSVYNKDKFFRGVIQESESALNTWAFQTNPRRYAFQLGKRLDSSLKRENSTQLLDILLKASTSEILQAQSQVENKEKIVGLAEDQIWLPVIETSYIEEPFIRYPMQQTFQNGHSSPWNKVPTLIGYNGEEAIWLLPKPNKNDWELTWDQVRERALNADKDPKNLISDKLDIPENKQAEAGRELKKLFTNSTFKNDLEAFVKFSSDALFIQPILRQAFYQARYTDVYVYQFEYTPRNYSIVYGAEHTEELQYFWGGDMGAEPQNDFQKKLRHRMLKLWTNFIKYQNPTPDRDEELDSVIWPRFNTEKYVNIDKKLEIRRNPRNHLEYARVLDKFKKTC